LQDLDKWSIPRQIHRWRCWLAAAPVDRQVVKELGVSELKANKGLSRTRQTAEEDEMSAFGASRRVG
jgi:hypothetical protein